MFAARLIDKSDYPVLRRWWDDRTEAMEWNEQELPPLGCLSEDEQGPAAAVWAHMSVGCGVALFDYACTRPGLSVTQASEAFRSAMEALEAALLANNYTLFRAFTRPGAERVIAPIGWQVGCRDRLMGFYKQVPLEACAATKEDTL